MSNKQIISTVDDLILNSSISDIRVIDYDIKNKKIIKGIMMLNNYNVWIDITFKTKLKEYLYSKKYKIDDDELFMSLISEKYLNDKNLFKRKNYIVFTEFNTCKYFIINLKDFIVYDIINEYYITRSDINISKKINFYKHGKEDFIKKVNDYANFLIKYLKKEHLDNVIKVVNNIFKDDYERVIIEDYKEMERSNAYYNNVTTLNFSEILFIYLKFLGLTEDEVIIVNNIYLNRNISNELKYVIINFEDGKRPEQSKIDKFIEDTEKKINKKLNTVIYCNYQVNYSKYEITDDNIKIANFYDKKELFEFTKKECGYNDNYTLTEKYNRFNRMNLQRNDTNIFFMLAFVLLSKNNNNLIEDNLI